MVRDMKIVNYIPVLFGLLFLISGVSAFSVERQTIDPSGTLNPGDTVNVSYTVFAASGSAFPSYDDLQFVSDLTNPVWSYSIIINGVENVRPAVGARTLTIAGFELSYRNQDEVAVKVSFRGTIPPTSALGAPRTLVKIQEIDARGYAISSSIVTIDHLIGEPTPTPTPAFGSIAVTSSPSGANVYLDNAYRGFTPLTLDAVPNGNHAVTLRLDGYEDSVQTVVVTGTMQQVNAGLRVRATPTPTAGTTAPVPGTTTVKPGQTAVPGSGSLSVTTTPPGALVYIDGVMRGITPATIPGIPAGDHAVSLTLTGYSVLTTNVTVEAGKTSEYVTGLSALAKTPGFELIAALLSIGGLVAFMKIRKPGK
jgi:hypothetical protein